MDKIHAEMEGQYFSSFSSPTTVGADQRSAETLRLVREKYQGLRWGLWPGQPPAKPVKEPTASAQTAPGALPLPKPKIQ